MFVAGASNSVAAKKERENISFGKKTNGASDDVDDDDVDRFLTRELMKESMRIEKKDDSGSAGLSDSDSDGGVPAPGYAPTNMFSARSLNQSVRLGMTTTTTTTTTTTSTTNRRPLSQSIRVSQLVTPAKLKESFGGIRASQVQRNISNFEDLVAETEKNPLSQSQSQRINVYLGSFGEMLSTIEVLINRYIDDEERLGSLLALHETISETLKAHDPQQFLQRGAGAGNSGGTTTTTTTTNGHRLYESDEFLMGIDPWDAYGEVQKEEKKEEEPEEESDHEGKEQMECLICMDDFWWPSKRAFKFNCCGNVYCMGCLKENYEVSINDGKCMELKCPNPTCATLLTEDDISQIIDSKLFARYQQFCFLASLRKDPTVRWCPRRGCETPVQGGSEEEPHLKCSTCNMEFCWKCNCEWHEGKTCKWAEKNAQKGKGKMSRQEKKAEKAIKKNSRPCPNCSAPIQKNSGCNHMHCQACQYDFCWVCMKHFEGYQHFEQGKCKGLQNWSNNYTKYGAYAGIGLGGVVVVGLAIPAVVVAGPPVAAVGLPLYGAYLLMKHK